VELRAVKPLVFFEFLLGAQDRTVDPLIGVMAHQFGASVQPLLSGKSVAKCIECSDDSGARRKAFNRAGETLIERGKIGIWQPYVWPTRRTQ
jgi:hypothetical protein